VDFLHRVAAQARAAGAHRDEAAVGFEDDAATKHWFGNLTSSLIPCVLRTAKRAKDKNNGPHTKR